MKHKLIIFIFFFFISQIVSSQEFLGSVQISASQIEGTDRDAFREMRDALNQFVNNTSWTNFAFEPEERIECTILLTLLERVSSDQYRGKLNLVLRRPVFNSNYNTNLLNYVDKDIDITYTEGEPLIFAENTFTSNLSSLMAYYLYIFLGLDGDSYSKLGGTPYFEKAQQIVQDAQNAAEPGWKAFEDMRNRYWLVENLMNQQYRPIREAIYEHHRKGLDQMYENAEKGRAAVAESIKLLVKADRAKPGSFLMRLYLDAKRDEIINIFSEGSPTMKAEVVNNMKELDPANGDNYSKILRN
jgi:hypothetical protein